MVKLAIPKIIHQIWLGPKEPPIQWMESWKNINRDWEYKLWTEKNIPKLHNQRQFDSITSYEGKADILRMEILYRWGGVYVDTDCECLIPIDDLRRYPFFACYENEHLRPGLIINTAIGCKPAHGLIAKMIEAISAIEDVNQGPAWVVVGPLLFTRTIRFYEAFHKQVTILPSYTFCPIHFLGARYSGEEKVYATHHWMTTTGKEYHESQFNYEPE
jgi:inositol phosphorylceramide mannosyltransferase catalytic subunit